MFLSQTLLLFYQYDKTEYRNALLFVFFINTMCSLDGSIEIVVPKDFRIN